MVSYDSSVWTLGHLVGLISTHSLISGTETVSRSISESSTTQLIANHFDKPKCKTFSNRL